MLGDPAIPRDNTYQVTLVIAGVTYVLDAGAIDKSVSKGQFINDGLTENAKCRIRGTATQRCRVLPCVRAERLSHPRGDGDLLRAGVLAKKASVSKALGGGPIQGRRFVQDYGPRHVNQLSPFCCCFIV